MEAKYRDGRLSKNVEANESCGGLLAMWRLSKEVEAK